MWVLSRCDSLSTSDTAIYPVNSMHQPEHSALSVPSFSEQGEHASAAAGDVRLEEKSIRRLVDPPWASQDIKHYLGGVSPARKLEIASTMFVCALALVCCLTARGQIEKLTETNYRLQGANEQLQKSLHAAESSPSSLQLARLLSENSSQNLRIYELTRQNARLAQQLGNQQMVGPEGPLQQKEP